MLNQTGRDREFTYSQIENVQFPNLLCQQTGINPTTDVINLYLKGEVEKGLHYRLMNINGKRLLEGTITGNPTTINMSKMAQATYFLQVIKKMKW